MANASEDYKFHQLIEKISDCYPPDCPEYHHVCFLSAKALDKKIAKTLLCKNDYLSKIYNEGFENQPDGRACFWYILNASGCSKYLKELRHHIGSVNKVNPFLQFRVLLSEIASGLDPREWSKLINTVGKTLPHPVTAKSLQGSENNVSNMLSFFEKTEQQCVIKHDNLEKLGNWLKDIGRQDLVEEYVVKFDSSKPVKLDAHAVMTPKQCSEEITTFDSPPCGEQGQAFLQKAMSEQKKPSKDSTELVKSFD